MSLFKNTFYFIIFWQTVYTRFKKRFTDFQYLIVFI